MSETKTQEQLTELALEAITKANEANASREKMGAESEEKFNKAAEDATKSLEEIQELKQKSLAQEKTIELLEKSFYRLPGTSEKEHEEQSKAYSEGLARYLKHGVAIESEAFEPFAKEMIDMTHKGVSEAQKEASVKALIEGINPQGGYWVQPQRVAKIVERIFETSPIRSIADVMTTATNEIEMIVDDNEAASGGWVGEVDSRGETATPDIGLLKIPVHEQFAQPKLTQRMMDDAGFDVEAWLQNKVSDKLGRDENTAFVLGDGAQKPQGFLTLPAWASPAVYERGKIEQINSGAATTFTFDGLVDFESALKEEYQQNAVFLIRRRSFPEILKLKDLDGRPLFDPAQIAMLRNGKEKVLFGKPLIFADDMPDVGAGNLSLAYGDFRRGYTVVDRFGIRVIRDELTEKPFIKIYATKRVGGAVTNFESIKIMKISA